MEYILKSALSSLVMYRGRTASYSGEPSTRAKDCSEGREHRSYQQT